MQLPDGDADGAPAAVALSGGAAGNLEENRWLRMVLSSIGDAVVAVDRTHRISLLNRAAEKLLNRRSVEAVGRPIDEVIYLESERDGGRLESPTARVLASGTSINLADEVMLVVHQGDVRPVEGSADPITDESGDVAGCVLILRDATRRRAAETALKASEDWLSLALDTSGQGAWDWDVLTNEVRWNANHEIIFGYAPGQASRSYRDFADRLHPDELPVIEAEFETAMRERRDYRLEHRVIWPDGTVRWVEAHGRFHFDHTGRAVRSVGVVIDVTERKRAAQEIQSLNRDLQRRVREFQTLIEVIPIGIAVADDPECRRIWCNEALARMLRMPEGTNISLSAPPTELPTYRVFHNGRELSPDELPMQAAIRLGREVRGFRQEVLLGDGQWVNLLSYAVPLRDDETGRIRGGLFACVDVTEQERTERALRSAERLFRAVFNQQLQYMAILDPDGTVLEANDTAFRATGVAKEAVIGRPLWEAPWWTGMPAMHERWKELFAAAARGDGPVTGQFDYATADGSIRHAAVVVTGINDGSGPVDTLILEGRDDTDRIEAEHALRMSENRWRTMAETLPNLVWTDLPDGQCDWLSSQWGRYTGIPEQELLGLNWLEKVLHPDDRARTLECWMAACADKADYDLEYRIRRHDGEYRWFKTRGVPIRDDDGRIIYWFGTCTDIEDQKRAEEALHEADRRKDEFLATLAHELRNPLAPIRSALQILRMPGLDDATREQSHDMMERQVHHLVRLVDDLLDVSRVMRGKITLHRESLDLTRVVDLGIETAQPVIDAMGHKLTIIRPGLPLPVVADAVRISQVAGNLLTNAAKYTEAPGWIRLELASVGNEAVMRVRDSGIGIAPETLPRIFDLFVQGDQAVSRSQGGLGIGLTLVKNLVEMHGGTVVARSEGLGRGSEFEVRLPLVGQEASASPAVPASGETAGPAATALRILVVDDNRDAARSLAIWLELKGHEVKVAHDGRSGLALAQSFRPRLVLLDLGMSGMDGFEVARRLRQQPGSEPICLAALTGWGQEGDRRRTRSEGFDHHLVKPVEPRQLDALLKGLR